MKMEVKKDLCERKLYFTHVRYYLRSPIFDIGQLKYELNNIK
jgi:hypothetical protein